MNFYLSFHVSDYQFLRTALQGTKHGQIFLNLDIPFCFRIIKGENPLTKRHLTFYVYGSVHRKSIQGYSKVPPGFPNSTAQQPRQTRQKGAYQLVENLSKFFFVLRALAYFQVPPLGGSREEKWRSQ